MSPFLLLLPLAGAATWPPGATVDPSATVYLTPGGLDALAGLLPEMLPSEIPIDPQSGEDGWWCFNYVYSLTGAWVGIEVVGADVTPSPGVIELAVDLMVQLNQPSDPFDLYVELACTGTDCPGYVEPFPVHVEVPVALDMVDDGSGRPVLDATVGDISYSYDLTGDDLQLDCPIQTVEDVLSVFGLSLYDLILDMATGALDDQVAQMGPQIEQAIEDAFAQASVDQDLDLNGAAVHLELYPSDVSVDTTGIALDMAGAASADPDSCIEAWDPGGSPRTDSDPPGPPGSDVHAAVDLSDDFVNELLYSLWRGGALCYDLSQSGGVDLGIPLDSSIFSLIVGDVYDDLFPETGPLVLATAPHQPPVARYDGAHDLDLDVRDLGLDFIASVDGRMARVLGMSLDASAGADIAFDGSTGELRVQLDTAGLSLDGSVAANELERGTDERVGQAFGSFLESVLVPLLDGFAGDLGFAMGAVQGIGLTQLQVSAAGDQGDWLQADATVGPVDYATGCDSGSGGCGGGGCSSSGAAARAAWPALILLGALLRRRS